MIEWLADRYGWRGCWLVTMGTVYLAIGLGAMLDPGIKRSWSPYDYAPVWVQAGGWLLTGAVAIWQGARGAHADDYVGHTALFVMPAVRMLSALCSWIVYLATAGAEHVGIDADPAGYVNAYYAALVWSLFLAAVSVGARWPNPLPPLVAPHPPDPED